jgi:hypothetical protein
MFRAGLECAGRIALRWLRINEDTDYALAVTQKA